MPYLCSESDYEVELVIVIGKEGKNISREKAFEHIIGVGNYLAGAFLLPGPTDNVATSPVYTMQRCIGTQTHVSHWPVATPVAVSPLTCPPPCDVVYKRFATPQWGMGKSFDGRSYLCPFPAR